MVATEAFLEEIGGCSVDMEKKEVCFCCLIMIFVTACVRGGGFQIIRNVLGPGKEYLSITWRFNLYYCVLLH